MPIVVKLPAEARTDLDLLSRLAVPGARGPVMLGNVATLAIDSAARRKIDRYDRLRNINFDIELNQQPLGEVRGRGARAAEPEEPAARRDRRRRVGDAEAMTELFDSFGLAMLTGVACIYIVLVLLFKDFVQPVTILVGARAVDPGRVPRALHHPHGAVDAVDDRPDHADGDRDQELDPAGRVRDHGAARLGHVAHGGAARRLPQARPADRR